MNQRDLNKDTHAGFNTEETSSTRTHTYTVKRSQTFTLELLTSTHYKITRAFVGAFEKKT